MKALANLDSRRIGVLGANSLVGTSLIPQLQEAGWQVIAFSRKPVKNSNSDIEWRQLDLKSPVNDTSISAWISLAPLAGLCQYFPWLKASGARHIVALSSTSRFTKIESSDAQERLFVESLIKSENQLQHLAEDNGIAWTLLRPTLIYGHGQDKNISDIVRFARRFHFFPLFGKAQGLRQPIHADDVAAAAVASLDTNAAHNQAFNISGAEVLTYRDMVQRIFQSFQLNSIAITVPLWTFRVGISCLRQIPRYNDWSVAMAERMNQDMSFDHTEARTALGFSPRSFKLQPADKPR